MYMHVYVYEKEREGKRENLGKEYMCVFFVLFMELFCNKIISK